LTDGALGRLLGQDYRNLLPLDEIDSEDIETFLDAWTGFHTLLSADTNNYHILKSQGAHAAEGAFSYLVNSNMLAGFALVAWPAEYETSGVMSFMLSRSGTLYEADLGLEGGTFASAMLGFDPDDRWAPVLEGFTNLEVLK
jgi:hypothetical protein